MADTLASGASGIKPMGVRLPPSAPFKGLELRFEAFSVSRRGPSSPLQNALAAHTLAPAHCAQLQPTFTLWAGPIPLGSGRVGWQPPDDGHPRQSHGLGPTRPPSVRFCSEAIHRGVPNRPWDVVASRSPSHWAMPQFGQAWVLDSPVMTFESFRSRWSPRAPPPCAPVAARAHNPTRFYP
jgi:hypothetical protein